MANPNDKLRRVPTRPPVPPLPDNEFAARVAQQGAAPAEGDAPPADDELPEGAFPLPCDCGPMPLPGHDDVEEPADGNA